ncbi:MAG: hypothetical protein J6K97_03440 [Clostridia bacterium]|nr:hypothetical protein [Clostridia bacterium]
MAIKSKKSVFVIIAMLFSMMLSLFSFSQPSSNALSTGQASVIASKCNLYNDADFESGKVIVLDEDEQPVIITLRLNDTVTINEIQGDWANVTTSKNIDGWIYRFYLTQNSSQDVYPVFNGKVLKDSPIFDMDLKESGHAAKANQRIFIYKGIEEEKGHEGYTAIQIVLEDGSLYSGYISTKSIEADGVSRLLIVAITIIVAAVTIILSIVFIRKKSKKKKNNKKSISVIKK